MTSVLLALNDKSTLTVISYHLERSGFVINSCNSTEEIATSIDRIEPNIIIIDEDISGTLKVNDVCHNIKTRNRTKNIHIILATKDKQKDNNFINDSIIKPFAPSELINKIKNINSATPPTYTQKSNKTLSYNGIEMNVNSFKVTRNDKIIHLGPTEFKILQCFLELPGKVLSREHIMNHVWGYNSMVEPRTIDVHINRLRLALKSHNDADSIIRTIRSAGYSLNITADNLVRI